jgi:hypothetical protein
MDPRLQKVVDEAEIREVMCRYARAIDRIDMELLRTCYHPGAIDDHGAFCGDLEGFIEWVVPVLQSLESSTHFLGQQLVEFDDGGDTAWVETYCFAHHRTKPDDPSGRPVRDWILNVRYCDRFERRDGEWRIAHRILVSEPSREDEVTFDSPPISARGTRDRNDQAYDRTSTRTTTAV